MPQTTNQISLTSVATTCWASLRIISPATGSVPVLKPRIGGRWILIFQRRLRSLSKPLVSVIMPVAVTVMFFITGSLVASYVLLQQLNELLVLQNTIATAEMTCPERSPKDTCYVLVITTDKGVIHDAPSKGVIHDIPSTPRAIPYSL